MDDKEIVEEIEEPTPLEVTIKKETPPKQPDFDYDDYTPTDAQILETEKEIQENITKRTKHGT